MATVKGSEGHGTVVGSDSTTKGGGKAEVSLTEDAVTHIDGNTETLGGSQAEVSLQEDSVADVEGSSMAINVLSNVSGAEHGAHGCKGTMSDYVIAMACVSMGGGR